MNAVVVIAVAVVMVVRGSGGESDLPLFIAFILTVFAAIPAELIYREDIERNPDLSPEERERWHWWRWRFPWSMLVYWWRYARRARDDSASSSRYSAS